MNSRVRRALALTLLATACSGCASLHHKAPVAAAPPPDVPELSQTPLYSPDMSENTPRLPNLPATSSEAAVVTTPPPPPQKPHRAKKTKPTKIGPASDTTAQVASNQAGGSLAPESFPVAPATIERKPTAIPASTPEPTAASPIGDLTAGSVAETQQTSRHTEDLVRTTRDGVQNIRRALAPDEKKTVSEIWAFLNRAEQAMKNGDVDGAYGLATKAKLLLDELTQQ